MSITVLSDCDYFEQVELPAMEPEEINWTEISRWKELTEDFIERHKHEVNWFYVSWKQKLGIEFIKKFEREIEFDRLPRNINTSEEVIRKFFPPSKWDLAAWGGYWLNNSFSESLVADYAEVVDWGNLINNENVALSDGFKFEMAMKGFLDSV